MLVLCHFNNIKKFLTRVTTLLDSSKKKNKELSCNFRKYFILLIDKLNNYEKFSYGTKKKKSLYKGFCSTWKQFLVNSSLWLPYHRSYRTFSIDDWNASGIFLRILTPNKIIILGTGAASRGRNSRWVTLWCPRINKKQRKPLS